MHLNMGRKKVQMKRISSYTFGEAHTQRGQVVSFTCDSEDGEKERVRTFIEEHIRDMEMPSTHRVNVLHGSHGAYSRYNLKQHKYAGGRGGYIEVLEIIDPPNNRHPIVIHDMSNYRGTFFSEWKDVESACDVYEKICGRQDRNEILQKMPGFIRLVNCGAMSPWFYAIGNEELIGDYTLPYGLEDDPYWRLGKKFVQKTGQGIWKLKTCIGSRFIYDKNYDSSKQEEYIHRIIYFDDGTSIQIEKDNKISHGLYDHTDDKEPPLLRPVRDDELWISEAIEKFGLLLSGKKEGFQIKFANGSTFVGKLTHKGKKIPSVEGDYLLKVTHVSNEIREGWVYGFKPTTEFPDIVTFVKVKSKSEVVKIEIIEHKPKTCGKKWSGVFFTSEHS